MRIQSFTPLLAVLLLGCRESQGLSFDRFVNVNVELRRAANETRTPADFAARKRAIESRMQVSDVELQQFVESHRSDMKVMSAAWDSVEARLGRASQRDAATRPTPQPQATTSPAGAAPVIPPQVGPDARGSGVTLTPAAAPAAIPPGTLPPPQTRPGRQKAVRF
ncbi:MAG TPA: hypothetical protein VF832_06305 [Longimicrobiales bacterium]